MASAVLEVKTVACRLRMHGQQAYLAFVPALNGAGVVKCRDLKSPFEFCKFFLVCVRNDCVGMLVFI